MPGQTLPSAPRILIGVIDPKEACALQTLLLGWSYMAETVSDGSEIIAALAKPTPPSVLLLDAKLPRFGGIELVYEIRNRIKLKSIWTVVISEDASTGQVMMAKDAGVDDFLVKPIDELDLRVRLHTATRVQALYAELARSVDEARFHSSHDRLTGLWNRECLIGMLFRETDRVQRMRTPLAFLLIDLDHFSEINVERGYDAGDNLLKQVATYFRRQLRSYDLIGRCGEDEFLIAMPGCTAEDAYAMAERLRTAIAKRNFNVEHSAGKLTISIGVAQSKGRSPLIVLREAERALAAAKRAGRNRTQVYNAAISVPGEASAQANGVTLEKHR